MSTSDISVARALELGVPRSWQEAVAVAIEAAEASSRSGHVATPEGCVISAEGGLVLHSVAAGSDRRAAASALLAALLEGQTSPPELRALAGGDGPDAQGGTLDGFVQALAYFAPPSRQTDIAAFARRSLAAEVESQSNAELYELRRAAGSRPAKAPEPTPRAPRPRWRIVAIAAAAAAWGLVAVTLFGWYALRAPAPSPAVTPAVPAAEGGAAGTTPPADGGLIDSATKAIDRATLAGLRAIGLAAPDEPSAAPASPPAAPRPATTTPVRRSSAPREPEETAVTAASPPPAPPAEAVATPELPTRAAEPPTATTPPEPSPVFFTSADEEVEAPVLVYPQLPSEGSPAQAPPGADHFELLINDAGTVERVRLLAREARLQDRMMVSAAKAWRFQPATKDGRPVRYLLRLPTSADIRP